MIIKVIDKKVRLVPEHDKDCFDLGYISSRISDTLLQLRVVSDTDNPKPQIEWIEISISDLIKNLRKGG